MHVLRPLVAAAVTAFAMAHAPVFGCDGLDPGPEGTVASVVDGDTVVLGEGPVVRLVGIQAPRLSKGRPSVPDWPLARKARETLAGLVLGKKVRLAYGGEKRDRYDRVLAQMFLDDGTWVQQAMLARGMARVYTFPDNRACAAELLAAERQGRAERAGLWTDPFYAILAADKPNRFAGLEGRYVLVEGRIVSTGKSGGRVYLDFGRDWSADFTVIIGPSALRLFDKAGIEPDGLGGSLVRVRGWLDRRNGPVIEVTHPEQIEVLARR